MTVTGRAVVIAGAYAVVAGSYIVFSGIIARGLADSVEHLERLERFKGIAFVVVTALSLFGVASVVLGKQLADAEAAARARETLLKSERSALPGLFVGSIAHDANNIFTVVGSALTFLDQDPGVSADSREALKDAQQAMAMLNRLFRDLKEMGRNRDVTHVPRAD